MLTLHRLLIAAVVVFAVALVVVLSHTSSRAVQSPALVQQSTHSVELAAYSKPIRHIRKKMADKIALQVARA